MSNTRKYAFLMIDYETPKLIKDIHSQIKDDELYVEKDNNSYGKETDTHVTVVPCLDNDINLNELKKYLDDLSKYELMLNNISVFENEKYDVLKCDAKSLILNNTNKKITDKYPTHSEHNEYHPHVTIAYLKPGLGERFKKDILSPLVILKPKQFHFSYVDDKGNEKEITFKN